MQTLRSMLLFAALALPSAALASPILYTLTATGSGNIGITNFSNAAITFTQVADLDNAQHAAVLNSADAFYTMGDNVLASIAGVGDYALSSAMFLTEAGALHVGSGVFGIYDSFSGGFYGIDSVDFLSYFLAAPLAPTSGANAVLDYTRSLISTGGDLHFSAFTGGSGSAIAATPEPSSLALLGTGMIGVIVAIRRRYSMSRA